MDAVGEDAVPHPAAGLEQTFDVPVQLVNVVRIWRSAAQDVGFELNARVVNVQVHPAGVADSGRSLGRHVRQACDARRFHESDEG